jgi:DNA invertase Pin-like site-specific DNA recombinase
MRQGPSTLPHASAHDYVHQIHQPADISGRSIPARGRGRLSLLRRRDSDAFLLARVRDVGSGPGTKGDRPELRKALDYCKRNKGAKLIVATMSRLTRDAKFLLTLLDGSVDVVFADLPQVPSGAQGKFFLTMMVAVAELEAGLTSERTRAALAQVKARGEKRLGNPTNLAEAQRKGAESMKAAADAFAAACCT